MTTMREFFSNFTKIKRTSIIFLHLLLPIVLTTLFLVYYAFAGYHIIPDVRLFFVILQICYPIFVSIVVPILINLDRNINNIQNALGSALACLNEGISLEVVKRGFENMSGVPGRCEIVTKKYNLGYEIIVDYAHTPDGLENILKTAREFTKGRLISVFGCGGDRDRTKRPIMGKIGTELSDIAVITSDNPRSEEPLAIIEDIKSGIKNNNYIVVENRREAIKKAMEIARQYDVIVVAGKGHEDYQILKDKTIHFDEREIIKELIEELY